mgnify:CR=1 FL=1
MRIEIIRRTRSSRNLRGSIRIAAPPVLQKGMPADAELEKLAKAAFTKIQGRGLGLSYETVHDVFLKKQARFAKDWK